MCEEVIDCSERRPFYIPMYSLQLSIFIISKQNTGPGELSVDFTVDPLSSGLIH
jgi:hypothetical protein